jgi:hypothetical protein
MPFVGFTGAALICGRETTSRFVARVKPVTSTLFDIYTKMVAS